MSSVDVTVQLSLGRFPVCLEPSESLHSVKNKLRTTIPALLQVNMKAFRFMRDDAYLTDDSKTVKEVGVKTGDTLHLIKKTASPNATEDSEKIADE
jgi:hypothetical protein